LPEQPLRLDRTSRTAWLLATAFGATWHYRLRDHTGAPVPGTLADTATLFAFWHEYLLPGFHFLRTVRPTALVSPSRDGQRLAAVLQRWGYTLARGSSTRQGQTALIECVQALQSGRSVAITPDGPMGPRRKAKHGVIQIARTAAVGVTALAFRCRPCMRLLSWDRFVVPLPFAGITVTVAPLIRPGGTPDQGADTDALVAAERGMSA
jgi:lysophospholipid acyltransferase (LPLAT)-like uncharacterized protein